jgi:hypothetical protein
VIKAFMTLNTLVKDLVSSSEIGCPPVTTLTLPKFFEKSANFVEDSLDIDIQVPMEAWHISTILGKPVNSIGY